MNRHPLLDDEPFYLSKYADRFRLRGWGGPVWRVYREPQADPELERLRQEIRQRGRYVILWHFGFPLVALGVMGILNVAGYIR